jgi:hypothetical protein
MGDHLTFDDIALLRRTLCDHFGLRLHFDRANRGHGRMVAPLNPHRPAAETEAAADLYNRLADMHALVD